MKKKKNNNYHIHIDVKTQPENHVHKAMKQ